MRHAHDTGSARLAARLRRLVSPDAVVTPCCKRTQTTLLLAPNMNLAWTARPIQEGEDYASGGGFGPCLV
eukprot:358672-Chlamydomonas_euryale.AAC.9